ncbi:MAG: FAD-dependent oxidoreductase [Bacteroidetes bacterium]|nr:MAG: FAD-dependent oxidoreductase [Bacteroidota bacterium]PTM14917.1 MAG: FAD-dependent oxidoreductase [Bacteroidota bacterium]
MNRPVSIDRLRTEEFDCLIIGGGASGTGCALDSALRGYKTALVEKADFAAATSSKSTKLIHGGVRYLEQAFKNLDFAQLAQVRHGLEERHTVLRNAPHLAHPQALVTPVFSWIEGLYFTLGLTVYGLFASAQDTLPGSKWLSKAETLSRIPGLSKKIHSAVLYYDGQLDDARYCLALAQTAAEAGAAVANRVAVVAFEYDAQGKLAAARVKDLLTDEIFRIRARVFINCTGPHADAIRQMANPDLALRLRPSKGVHAILPFATLGGTDALLIPKTKDGRVVFAIPFFGKLMVGTTDTEYHELDKEPQLEGEEVDFLLETLNRYLETPATPNQVQAGFGGLRPLLAADPRKSTKGLVRDHEVEHDPASNLVSLLGGKWTTYRLMAKDTIDYLADHLLPNTTPCPTAEHYLVGGANYDQEAWRQIQARTNLPQATCRHLGQHYGNRVDRLLAVLDEDPAWQSPLVVGYPFLVGEVVYAARHEMALTVRDFLARRIRLEILDWDAAQQATTPVAAALGHELGWDAPAQELAAASYSQLLFDFRKRSQQAEV